MDLNWQPAPTEDDDSTLTEPETSPPGDFVEAAPTAASTATSSSLPTSPWGWRSRRLGARATVAGALVVGAAVGSVILAPAITTAQTPTTAPSSSAGTGTIDSDPAGHPGGPGFGGHTEAVTDTSVVAKAIGISEADLITALQGGQTMAAVAKTHNVDVQKVIDALVADAKSELAAAVKAGTITQAQADAEQANVLARVTDQVNGAFRGGRGPGGPGFGGHTEAVTDTSVVAKTIGISEADLITALQGGQTMAAVAKAHNVDVQKVIDALVADKKTELAAAVKAGTITQAQADAEQANVLARVTDQVNGTFAPH